jgi:antitoxin MazE
MRSTIRKIGNSKGIILPQKVLKQCFIEDEVTIEVQDNAIIIRPANDIRRKDWVEAFKEMAKNEDDTLLIPDIFEDENLGDWTWK